MQAGGRWLGHSMKQNGLSRHELPRKLGWLDATMIVVGIVIGSGIFLLPNLIAQNLHSSGAILSAWIISGVLSYFGALAYAELGAMMPATGGQYVYLREAYGPACAFVCGWTFMLAVLSGGIAFLAVSFSIYAGQFVHLTPVDVETHLLGADCRAIGRQLRGSQGRRDWCKSLSRF